MDNFIRPAVVWSAGKDSTVVLNLVREVARDRKMAMPPAILIDHGQHYDETYKMVKDISKEWGFKVIYAGNDDFLSKVDNNSKGSTISHQKTPFKSGWIHFQCNDQSQEPDI